MLGYLVNQADSVPEVESLEAQCGFLDTDRVAGELMLRTARIASDGSGGVPKDEAAPLNVAACDCTLAAADLNGSDGAHSDDVLWQTLAGSCPRT